MNEATRQYIEEHITDNVHLLALQGVRNADVDLPFALQQIVGRQRAKNKLPSWAANPDILWPKQLAIEQCSSEQTAQYKAQIAGIGQIFVDLTGGFGVDFSHIAPRFHHSVYVEQQPELCALAAQNFKTLKLRCVKTVCEDSMKYLQAMEPADFIYLDPARRDDLGARTYAISDCTPNILEHMDLLLQKGKRILLKLSPMLDWRKAWRDIGKEHVSHIHIVSVGGECKELLLLLQQTTDTDSFRLVCVNDDETITFSAEDIEKRLPTCIEDFATVRPGNFLFEPNASIMKSGCFGAVAGFYNVKPIANDSHLFVSETETQTFPGRRFRITHVTSMNKHDLRMALKECTRANISVRNFPLSPEQLRQRLRLRDGGDTYLFATTLANGQHVILFCKKAL